jgi:hypothetical protein
MYHTPCDFLPDNTSYFCDMSQYSRYPEPLHDNHDSPSSLVRKTEQEAEQARARMPYLASITVSATFGHAAWGKGSLNSLFFETLGVRT